MTILTERGLDVAAPARSGLLWGGSLIVALFAFILGTLDAEAIYTGGDAVRKWLMAQLVIEGDASGVPFDHHTMRWAINGPAIGVIALFGASAFTYLVAVSAVFAGVVALVWSLGMRLAGPLAAAMAVFLVFVDPLMLNTSAQLQPTIFGLTGLLIAVAALWSWQREEADVWLVVTALALFFAYGAKITNLFFFPGPLLLLMVMGKWRAIAIIGAIFVALFAVETFAIRALSGGELALGRIEGLTSGRHVDLMSTHEELVAFTWGDLFLRWWPMYIREVPMKSVIFAFFVVAALHPFLRRRVFTDETNLFRADVLVAMGVSFAFFTTFFIISIDPLLLGQDLRVRYLYVLQPFAALMVAAYVAALLGRLRFLERWPVALGSAAVGLASLGLVGWKFVRAEIDRDGVDGIYAVWQANGYFEEMRTHLERGCTIYVNNERAATTLLMFAFPPATITPNDALYYFRPDGSPVAGTDATVSLEMVPAEALELDHWRRSRQPLYRLSLTGGDTQCEDTLYVGDTDVRVML